MTTTTAPAPRGLLAKFHAWRTAQARRAARKAVFDQTMAQMAAMSPAELAEYGFSKAKFERFAWETAYARVPD